jgi:hypothetical protein
VNGWLQDFLFTPDRARTPVRSAAVNAIACCWRGCSPDSSTCWCSTSPPTISMWKRSTARDRLLDFGGTLLLVSHDRAFLDAVVTSTLVFEGKGTVEGVCRRLLRLGAPASRNGTGRYPCPFVRSGILSQGWRYSAGMQARLEVLQDALALSYGAGKNWKLWHKRGFAGWEQ